MNKSWFYLGAIGSVAIALTSCGDKPPTPAPSPSAAVSPSPVAAVPATTPVATTVTTATTTTTTAATVTPTSGKKSVSVDVAAGLIAPTNGDNWAKTVSKGRSDPFAALALQPVQVAEKDLLGGTGKPQKVASAIASTPSIAVKTADRTKTIASNSSAVKTANQTKTIASNSSAIKSGVNKKLPIIKVSSSILPKGTNITKQLPSIAKIATKPTKLPKVSAGGKIATNRINRDLPKIQALPPAKPEQALAIQISGVIEAAGKTQVIIKLPGETFSRYIEVGERVANGRVLIKRIEGQLSFSPTVILEEVGVEVPRKIGDRQVATAPQSAPQPAAATAPATPNPIVEILPSAPQPANITPDTSKP